MTTATATATTMTKQTFTILAADKLAAEGLSFIENQPDAALLNKPGLTDQEYAGLIAAGGIHGMIVRSGVTVTADMLKNPGDLKVIARAGVGVDNIDLDAATAHGILVMNSAEASTVSTAELAFALMIGLSRNIGHAHMKVASGGWDRSAYKGRQLAGQTLGVVGFGRIGQTLAARALAFDMQVVAYDPFINAKTMLDGEVRMFTDFEAMLPEADILSFHVPLNDETRGMLGAKTFPKCRDGVKVVNASRGGVVDEDALVEALSNGKCSGAALDVYTHEPPAEDSPLRNHPMILTTPHLGASTQEAQTAVSVAAAEQALAYLRGHGVKGAVNAGGLRVDLDPQQAAFADLVRRMATLINPMVTRGISEVTLEVRGKGLATVAGTLERYAMCELLRDRLTDPVNIINVIQVANDRGIHVKTTTEEAGPRGPEITLIIQGPEHALDDDTDPADQTRRIVGRVYDDLRPRVVEINGYHMDMVPAGHMVLQLNEDKPGVIGTVGQTFGSAGVNIADMAISRRKTAKSTTALMLLKVDQAPGQELIDQMVAVPGILKVSAVKLADEVDAVG